MFSNDDCKDVNEKLQQYKDTTFVRYATIEEWREAAITEVLERFGLSSDEDEAERLKPLIIAVADKIAEGIVDPEAAESYSLAASRQEIKDIVFTASLNTRADNLKDFMSEARELIEQQHVLDDSADSEFFEQTCRDNFFVTDEEGK